MQSSFSSKDAARSQSIPNESGAALVETSIVMLVVFVVIAGILDYATLFGNTIDVSAATQLAARTGASTTTSVTADHQIVDAVVKKPGGRRSGIQRVVIYKAGAATAGPPADCKAATGPLPAQQCNVYMQPDFALGAALPTQNGWPLSSRVPGIDYIGVWVEVEREPLFKGLLWSPSIYSDYTVMRLEPVAAPMVPGRTDFSTGTNRDPGLDGAYCIGGGCETTGVVVGGSGSGGSS